MATKQVNRATDLNVSSATGYGEPGHVWYDGSNGKAYKMILVEDANLAANDVVEYADSTGYEVTNDRAGGSSLGRTAAGVAVATVTDGNYGFIQVEGVATAKVAAATAISAGDLITTATTDGCVETATTSTFKDAFAVALSADTATTSAAGTCTIKLFRV